MLSYSLYEKHIKKDSWLKEIRKTFAPELLADLIKKRIEFPGSTGPYVRNTTENEVSTDIIDALIAETEENRRKLEPAVGLLLYKMLHDKMTESHDILRGVFAIIHQSKLVECNTLVYSWLKNNEKRLVSNDARWKQTYRDGIMAYAQVQNRGDKENEDWWHNIWREGSSAWWPAAFLGLRIQNPIAACEELSLLMTRNTDKTQALLVGTWSDPESRSAFERAIKRGLDENTGWAGFALNMVLEKLTDPDKEKLMLNLKNLNKPN